MNKGIIPIVVLVFGVIVALWFGFLTGQGDIRSVNVGIVMMIGIPIVLALGVRSWYILPFGMISSSLPALPFLGGRSFSMSELAVLFAASSMAAVVATGKMRLQLYHRFWIPLLIFFAWVVAVALANGVGLAVLGNSAMGGRRYISVFLAIVGMVLMSQITMNEAYARKTLIIILCAAALETLYQTLATYIGRSGPAYYEFYSWHQGLAIFGLAGVTVMFSKYSPRDLLGRPMMIVIYILLLGLVVLSAKRFSFAACLAIPFISAFWNRQLGFALFGAAFAVVALGLIIMIQNTTGGLPKGMQRVFHFLPADWDSQVDDSTNDIFRETLNRLAFEKIRKRPIIGEGVMMTVEDVYIMESPDYIRSIMQEGDDPLAFPHAAGKNWHSTWIGTAAILGIPGALLWIVVQFGIIAISWRMKKFLRLGSWNRALASFCFVSMSVAIMRSMTSGDLTPLTMHAALLLGLLCAIEKGIKEEQSEPLSADYPVNAQTA